MVKVELIDKSESPQPAVSTPTTTTTRKPKQTKVPFRVVKAWNNLEPSIASVFRESKWPAKFALFEIFKDWYDKLEKEV